MNRKVIFRGKTSKGEWLYGNLVDVCDGLVSIVSPDELARTPIDFVGVRVVEGAVQRDTIGQWTGMDDSNGVAIYEGDVVEAWSEGRKAIGEVKKRKDGLWLIYPAYQDSKFWTFSPDDNGRDLVEILGNVFDNPELIKEEKK